jgi:membrane-bound lytic murein transglycosylase B
MESNFGKDLGSMGVMRSLATLMYAGRKRDYARGQLIAAFKILQRGIRKPGRDCRVDSGRQPTAYGIQ